MGPISTPSGSLVLEIYHYANVNGVLGWPENAESENFDPFSNAQKKLVLDHSKSNGINFPLSEN